MFDFASINAIATSLKTALDITKDLRDTETTFDRAESRLKLAELMVALADVKVQLASFQDELLTRDAKISALTAAIETKAKVVRRKDAIYLVGEDGAPHGWDHCLRCWQTDHVLRGLVNSSDYNQRWCPTCETPYPNYAVGPIQPAAGDTST